MEEQVWCWTRSCPSPADELLQQHCLGAGTHSHPSASSPSVASGFSQRTWHLLCSSGEFSELLGYLNTSITTRRAEQSGRNVKSSRVRRRNVPWAGRA